MQTCVSEKNLIKYGAGRGGKIFCRAEKERMIARFLRGFAGAVRLTAMAQAKK